MKSIILLTLVILGFIESFFCQSTNNAILVDGGTLNVQGTFYSSMWDESNEVEHPFLWVCNEKCLSSLPIVKIETLLNSKSVDLSSLPENSYSIINGKFELKESFFNHFYEVELVSKKYNRDYPKGIDWTFEISKLKVIDKMPECFENVPIKTNINVNITGHGCDEGCEIYFQETGKPMISKSVESDIYWETIWKQEELDTTTFGLLNLQLSFERYNLDESRNIPFSYSVNLNELNGTSTNDSYDYSDEDFLVFDDYFNEFQYAVKTKNINRILQLSDLNNFKTHDASIGPKELIEMEGWGQIERALESGLEEDYYTTVTNNDYPRLIFCREQGENWKWCGIILD